MKISVELAIEWVWTGKRKVTGKQFGLGLVRSEQIGLSKREIYNLVIISFIQFIKV